MQDINEIKERFKEVIAYSQGIQNPEVDELFQKWFKAKEYFIKAMNHELIYESPHKMTFSLDAKDKLFRIDVFVDIVNERWNNEDLADFIYYMRDSFFDNITTEDYEYKGQIIKKGTKLIRAFKYFEEDKYVLTEIQNHASRIIQEDKIEGTLCLSVHPLDYLSASENTYNWRSCHALDGDYRSGNLSYMVDNSTILCYLKADNDEL